MNLECPPGCPTTELDPWAEEVLLDRYPVYQRLRDIGPVVWSARHTVLLMPRYADVRAALNDWETYSSAQGAGVDHEAAVAFGESIVTTDPPLHTTYRRPLADLLSAPALVKEKPTIEAVAEEFAARLVAQGTFDAVTEMASPYSVKIVADLCGLGPERRDEIGPLGERGFNTMGPVDDRHLDGIAALEALDAITYADTENLCPGSHGAHLVATGHPDALGIYTFPGIDTTVHALSSAVFEFARHPEQWEAMRADRSLVPAAFNEVLRLHSPVQTFTRVTARPVTVGGVEIPVNTRVAMMWGSANRDERKYPDPDRFDITRNPIDHLAFGRGIHMCVGMHLARNEAHSLLNSLADRVERFELAGEPVWKPNNTLHGLGSLPVQVIATT